MKKILSVIMVLAFVAVFAAGVLALSMHDIYYSHTIFRNSIQGFFTVGYSGTNNWGMDTTRRIRGCRVYLRESGNVWTAANYGAANDNNRRLSTKKVEQPNGWFQPETFDWEWYYFAN